MKALVRNKQKFYYALYDGTEPITDEYGNETGEPIVKYSEPVEMWANISTANGYAQTEQFGNLDSYDKVLVTDDLNCPIDEHSVLFIETVPATTEVTTHEVIESETVLGDDEIIPKTEEVPKYDYIVKRVAKSLNSISIAIRKVDVS